MAISSEDEAYQRFLLVAHGHTLFNAVVAGLELDVFGHLSARRTHTGMTGRFMGGSSIVPLLNLGASAVADGQTAGGKPRSSHAA